jgi:hypothetical protein
VVQNQNQKRKNMARTRTRSSAASAAETPARSGGIAGAMRKENEKMERKRAQGHMPFRFWQKKGEECEVIILDESLDKGFWRHEHNLQIDGKWGHIEPCIQETGKCPFCEDGSYSSLVAFLSVLVMRPYINKAGETKEFSKMFLCFKRGQFAEFERIEKIAVKNHGTLRGTSVILHREDEDNSFSTGAPVPNDDGNIINDWLSEEELVAEFGHPELKGRESGKVLKKKNEDIEPFAYRILMPAPDADAIREQLGDGPVAGSRAESDGEDDEIPGVPNPRSARTRTRGGAAAAEPEAEVTPARSRRTRGARPPVDDVDGEDGEDGEEGEEPSFD